MPNAPASILADPDRLRALHDTGLLDSPTEPAFDRLTRLAARVLRVPTTLVSLVDADRQFFKACVGVGEPWASARGTPISHSFCQHVVALREPLVIDDARAHPLVLDNPAIDALDVVAYLGIPLVTREDVVLGSLCAIDSRPRHWSDEDVSLLADIAESVMTEIEMRIELGERRRVQGELVAAKEAAERASAAKSEFMSRMSHELRTPLNAIIGFSKVLRANRGGRLAPQDVMLAERVAVNGTHLLALIDQILDLAKIEAGKVELRVESVELGALSREVMEQLESRVDGKPVALRREVPDRLRPLETDGLRLKQVLVNLVGNALKFTQAGEVVLRVAANADGTPRRIEVSDSGIGIPPERLDAIFDAFEQADRTTERAYGGTGLGLAISRELCALLGYSLSVTSTVGRGSTFTVDLAP